MVSISVPCLLRASMFVHFGRSVREFDRTALVITHAGWEFAPARVFIVSVLVLIVRPRRLIDFTPAFIGQPQMLAMLARVLIALTPPLIALTPPLLALTRVLIDLPSAANGLTGMHRVSDAVHVCSRGVHRRACGGARRIFAGAHRLARSARPIGAPRTTHRVGCTGGWSALQPAPCAGVRRPCGGAHRAAGAAQRITRSCTPHHAMVYTASFDHAHRVESCASRGRSIGNGWGGGRLRRRPLET